MDFVGFCRYLRRQEDEKEFETCSHGFLDCKTCDRLSELKQQHDEASCHTERGIIDAKMGAILDGE
jgi:hypothetical protein